MGPRGAARRWVGLDVFLFGLNAQKKPKKEKNGGGEKTHFQKKQRLSQKKNSWYNSTPWDAPFFAEHGRWDSDYGRFFLEWYSSRLVGHADLVLGACREALDAALEGRGSAAAAAAAASAASAAASAAFSSSDSDSSPGLYEKMRRRSSSSRRPLHRRLLGLVGRGREEDNDGGDGRGADAAWSSLGWTSDSGDDAPSPSSILAPCLPPSAARYGGRGSSSGGGDGSGGRQLQQRRRRPRLGAKLAGVHWWYGHPSHAAELTVRFFFFLFSNVFCSLLRPSFLSFLFSPPFLILDSPSLHFLLIPGGILQRLPPGRVPSAARRPRPPRRGRLADLRRDARLRAPAARALQAAGSAGPGCRSRGRGRERRRIGAPFAAQEIALEEGRASGGRERAPAVRRRRRVGACRARRVAVAADLFEDGRPHVRQLGRVRGAAGEAACPRGVKEREAAPPTNFLRPVFIFPFFSVDDIEKTFPIIYLDVPAASPFSFSSCVIYLLFIPLGVVREVEGRRERERVLHSETLVRIFLME